MNDDSRNATLLVRATVAIRQLDAALRNVLAITDETKIAISSVI